MANKITALLEINPRVYWGKLKFHLLRWLAGTFLDTHVKTNLSIPFVPFIGPGYRARKFSRVSLDIKSIKGLSKSFVTDEIDFRNQERDKGTRLSVKLISHANWQSFPREPERSKGPREVRPVG